MKDKSFKSISEQLKILSDKNLSFINEADAAQKLSNFGYYEIINGYRQPFMKDGLYKEGTTFDDVFALYYFDSKLRPTVMSALEYAEAFLKQKLALTLGEKYGDKFENYMSTEVFMKGEKLKCPNPSKGMLYSRDLFLYKMSDIRYGRSDQFKIDPYNHYRRCYENVPPWILVKGMSFGNLRTAIRLLKPEDKRLFIQRVYDTDVYEEHTETDIHRLFFETIKIIRKYRNRVAHGGRIYNYFPDVGFTYINILHVSADVSKTAIDKNKKHSVSLQLLFTAINLWQSKYSSAMFKIGLNEAVKGYSNKW
jgi:Abortive infection bacteriophage resistance protein